MHFFRIQFIYLEHLEINTDIDLVKLIAVKALQTVFLD